MPERGKKRGEEPPQALNLQVRRSWAVAGVNCREDVWQK